MMPVSPGAPTSPAAVEATWVRQVAGGHREAFEELYRVYRIPLFRFLFRMVGRSEMAEELVTDVMVAIWKGAATFREGSKVSTWVFGIARHKALNARRGRRPREIELSPELASTAEDPEERIERDDLGRRLRQVLATLSPEHREVVLLTFVEGLSYAEIAAVARCPVNTVKTRMFHARRKLQEALQSAGLAGGPT